MAKQAASTIGVDPKLLIAQAALETNWEKTLFLIATINPAIIYLILKQRLIGQLRVSEKTP